MYVLDPCLTSLGLFDGSCMLTLTSIDVSKVVSIDDTDGIGAFFDGFAVSPTQNGTAH